MQQFKIGDLIRKKREELDVSLSDLSSGICSIAHLSRIENKEKKADLQVLLAILGRLQFQPRNLECYLSYDEYEMISLKYKIKQELNSKNIFKVKEYLEKFIKLPDVNKNLSKQFLLRTNAEMLISLNHNNNEDIAKLLNDSVLCTVNNYKMRIKERKILSQDELEIIILLLKYTSDPDRIYVLRELMDYCLYYEEICSKYLLVYFDVKEYYAEVLYEKELFDECLTICKETLHSFTKISSLLCRADFFYLKAKCEEIRGIDSKEDYLTAYYLYNTFDKDKAEKVKKHLEDNLKWEFTM